MNQPTARSQQTTFRKGEANGVGKFDNQPCFGGCAPLTRHSAGHSEFAVSPLPSSSSSSSVAVSAAREAHGPATFSLVIPWCCEWVSFILKEVDFKGHLREIYLYDKCSHTGLVSACRQERKRERERKKERKKEDR